MTFEELMKEKYPHLTAIHYEELVDNKERYTAWLKFPYYSTDSNGGFFSFFTEEEFEQYMTSSIRMLTEEEIKNEWFEVEQYKEFYEHKMAEFNLDKALYLYYKARMEMEKCLLQRGTKVIMRDGRIGVIDDNDFVNSETFNDVNYYVYPVGDEVNYEMYLAKDILLFDNENLSKIKPKIFKVVIEEQINQTFEVEAADLEGAMQLAEERYNKGEYVLDGDANVSARLMSVEDENGDYTEWVQF